MDEMEKPKIEHETPKPTTDSLKAMPTDVNNHATKIIDIIKQLNAFGLDNYGKSQFEATLENLIANHKSLESKVFSSSQFIGLNAVCGFPVEQKWKLIYRASDDGFGAADSHRKCNGVANTLTVVRSLNEYIFGGYKNDVKSIFSFKGGKFTKFEMKRNSGIDPPSRFGEDIRISDHSNKNTLSYSDLGHTCELPTGLKYGSNEAKYFLAGSYNFLVEEIEVFTKI
jgi:hypothetical protein